MENVQEAQTRTQNPAITGSFEEITAKVSEMRQTALDLNSQADGLTKSAVDLMKQEIEDRIKTLAGFGHNYKLSPVTAQNPAAPKVAKPKTVVKKTKPVAKAVSGDAPFGRAKDGTPYKSAGQAAVAKATAKRWAEKRRADAAKAKKK